MPIVNIENGTFYRSYPSPTGDDASSNQPMFPNLVFKIASVPASEEHWAIIGPSNAGKTTFCEILQGQHFCNPPTARSFPYLSSGIINSRHRAPAGAIQYVGFNGERGGVGRLGTRGAYLSARYESRREDADFSVLDFIRGSTHLNASEDQEGKDFNARTLDIVVDDLNLEALVHMPMGNLSNGQMRRARIARALLGHPLVLLLDEPFMGLDPPTITNLIPLLHNMAKSSSPRLILALRPQDLLPEWITHIAYLSDNVQIVLQGKREDVLRAMNTDLPPSSPQSEAAPIFEIGSSVTSGNSQSARKLEFTQNREESSLQDSENSGCTKEVIVRMHDVCVKYGGIPALGGWKVEVEGQNRDGLSWTIRRGDRWGVFGPNGSGKTTLLSLICSDHPQSYSLPIELFGKTRLPQPGQLGISIFDIQARIGHSSPEIHAFFPRTLSLRQTVRNAWADTFLGVPRLGPDEEVAVDACLRWFEAELNSASASVKSKSDGTGSISPSLTSGNMDWADEIKFGEAPFSAQRVALFLRAIVKKPDLVVLDEAFSGMDEYVRDKCMLFLTWGELRSLRISLYKDRPRQIVIDTDPRLLGEKIFRGLNQDQALICVSHVNEEVPGLVREWISLPEASSGKPAKIGKFQGPVEGRDEQWQEIWRA